MNAFEGAARGEHSSRRCLPHRLGDAPELATELAALHERRREAATFAAEQDKVADEARQAALRIRLDPNTAGGYASFYLGDGVSVPLLAQEGGSAAWRRILHALSAFAPFPSLPCPPLRHPSGVISSLAPGGAMDRRRRAAIV